MALAPSPLRFNKQESPIQKHHVDIQNQHIFPSPPLQLTDDWAGVGKVIVVVVIVAIILGDERRARGAAGAGERRGVALRHPRDIGALIRVATELDQLDQRGEGAAVAQQAVGFCEEVVG